MAVAVDGCAGTKQLDLGDAVYVQGSTEYNALTDEAWLALRHRKVNILRPETADQLADHIDFWDRVCARR